METYGLPPTILADAGQCDMEDAGMRRRGDSDVEVAGGAGTDPLQPLARDNHCPLLPGVLCSSLP